ncbi:subtilisin family serine protease [Nonomuraea thailandensis]|uniref:Subtilisin family serine protease n=1 Tax=Nonomuraea thailandensis TaxID=1188745 RepID=A0A9X2G756_9ACTN|nr:S8 family serine peptidase [Nonomuraea thailandensis]MCP2353819.1 subtilisin family serine protease [Nonomuraea thailandensis]
MRIRAQILAALLCGGLVAAGTGVPAGARGAAAEAARPAASDPGSPGTQTDPPQALDVLDQRDLQPSGTFSWRTTGRNVHAYVLGDRISTTHTTFGGRAVNGPDFTGNPQCPLFDNWGTGLASAVGGARHGVAKEVRIIGVRVMACANTTTPERLVQGLDWVTANAVKPAVAVLNVAVGADSAVDAAALRLIRSGVTLVADSGMADSSGDRDSTKVSPARLSDTITVGRTWGDLIESRITRTGPNVDLFAWFSVMAIGGGSDEYAPTLNSAGLVAGAAALLLAEQPAWTPAQVQQALVNQATPGLIRNPSPEAPNLMLHVGP